MVSRFLLGTAAALAVAVGCVSCASGAGEQADDASAADSTYRGLLDQLQEMPEVRSTLMAPVEEGQVVLCGIDVVGREEAERSLFAFLMCGTFSTGPGAEMVSGGSDPVVITTDDSASDATVVDVRFPAMAHRKQDIRRMFPPALVETMLSPQDLPYRPTMDEMVAAAEAAAH